MPISIFSNYFPKIKSKLYSLVLFDFILAMAILPLTNDCTSELPSYWSWMVGETYFTWNLILTGDIKSFLPINYPIITTVSIKSPKECSGFSISKINPTLSQGFMTTSNCPAKMKPNIFSLCTLKGHSLKHIRMGLAVGLVKLTVYLAIWF